MEGSGGQINRNWGIKGGGASNHEQEALKGPPTGVQQQFLKAYKHYRKEHNIKVHTAPIVKQDLVARGQKLPQGGTEYTVADSAEA